MSNILKYKGYQTKIEFDRDDLVLHGKIEGIKSLVNFESDNAEKIEEEFHNAVDDYLFMCEEYSIEPEKSYSGCFNVRISSDLHKKVSMASFEEGITLNQFISNALEKYFDRTNYQTVYILTQPIKYEKRWSYTDDYSCYQLRSILSNELKEISIKQ